MEERLVLIIDPSKAESGAAAAEKATDSLEKSAKNLTKTFESFQKQLNSTGSVLSSFEGKMKLNSFDTLQKSLSATATSFDNMLTSISGSQRMLTTLFNRLESVSTKVSDLKTSVGTLSTAFNTSSKEINTASSRTVNALTFLKDNAYDVKTSFTQVRNESNNLSTRFNSLYTHSGNLRDSFKELNTPVGRATTLFTRVNESLDVVNTNVRNTSSNTKVLGQDFLTLSGKTSKTAGSMDFFRDRLVALNREFTPLKSNVSKMSGQLESTEKKIKELGKSFTGLSSSMKNAASGLDAAVARLRKMDEELTRVKKASADATVGSHRFSGAISGLGATIGTLGMSHLVGELVRVTDGFKAMQNKLVVVTGETEDLAGMTQTLLKVSRESRTSLEATMDVFAKLTRVNKQYGYSQEELLTVTTTVAQAVAMSGATAQGAQGAMIQFAQALSGNFQAAAQELNSIIEQTPALADAIAEGLNSTEKFAGITSSQLKKLAADQKLKTREILQGLINTSQEVNDRFQLSAKLVSQGWQAVKDSVSVYIGEVDKAYGITDKLATLMFEFAENGDMEATMRALGAAVSVLAVGAAAAFTAIVGIPAAIATLGFAIASVGAATVAYFWDDIVDTFERLPLIISEGLLSVFSGETDLFSSVIDFFSNMVDKISSFFAKGGEVIYNSISGYFSKYSEVLSLTGSYIANSISIIGADFGVFIQGMWSSLMSSIEDGLNTHFIPLLNDLKRKITETINDVRSFFGQDLLEFNEVSPFTFSDSSQEELDRLIGIRDNYKLVNEEIKKGLELGIEKAKTLDKQTESLEKIDKVVKKSTTTTTTDTENNKKLARELAKLEKEYQKILGTSDEVLDQQKELSDAWNVLTKYASIHKDKMIDVNAIFVKFSQEVLGVNEAIKDAKEFYADLNSEISETNEVTQKMAEAEKHLTVLLNDGTISITEKNSALVNYRAQIDGTIDKQKELSESIADTFMDGFEAAMEGTRSFMDFFKNALKQMALDALKSKIIIPISNTLAGLNIGGTGLGGGFPSLSSIGSFFTGGLNPISAARDFFSVGTIGNAATGALTNTSLHGAGGAYGLDFAGTGASTSTGLMSTITSGIGSIMSTAVPAMLALNIIGDIFEGSKPTLTFAQGETGQQSVAFDVTRPDREWGIGGDISTGEDVTQSFDEAFGAYIETAFGRFGTLEGKFSKKVDEAALDAMFNFVSSLDEAISNTIGSEATSAIAESLRGIFLPEGELMGNLDGRGGTFTPQEQLLDRYSQILTQIIPEEFVTRLTSVKDLDLDTFAKNAVLSITVIEKATDTLGLVADDLVEIADNNKKGSEDFIDTLIRVTTQASLAKQAFESLDQAFDLVGQDAINAGAAMARGAGGEEALLSDLLFYDKVFVNNTEGLQFLQHAQAMSKQFAELGYALPTTNQGFKDILSSLDLTTEAGQVAYGQLIAMSEGVASFVGSLDAMYAGLKPLTDLSMKIREDLMSEQELYNFRKTQAEALSDMIGEMTDPSAILAATDQIEQLVSNMWGSLDEIQRTSLGEDFITYLDEVAQIAQDRLTELTTGSIQSGIEASEVSDERIAEMSIQAAENMSAASSDLAEAARILVSAASAISSAVAIAPVLLESTQQTGGFENVYTR